MRVALIAAIGLLAACGDDGVTIDTNDENFCEQISDVICHNIYSCCTESEIQSLLDVSEPRTELQCREDIKRRCDRTSPDLRDSLDAGRVTFDAARLNACLTAILAPDGVCAEVVQGNDLPWTEACEEAPWVGTVATGGSCFFNFDCAGGVDSFCGPDQKCKAKPTAGFPCGTGCASDYYCATNGTCAAKVAAGAPCTSNTQCQEDLYCDQYATPEPVCAMKQAGGATCTTSSACLSSDCVPGKCMGTTLSCYMDSQCNSRCANTGFSCTDSSDCALGTCDESSISCDDESDCVLSATDDCVFPVMCVPGDCIGDPVCTSETLVADYCSNVGFIPDP